GTSQRRVKASDQISAEYPVRIEFLYLRTRNWMAEWKARSKHPQKTTFSFLGDRTARGGSSVS
ncbi:MAG: hypothetical protein NTW32_24160, partial [Chloroflexi bacterium]|nr:hypothetical protein [Chloroflexota bacterium]